MIVSKTPLRISFFGGGTDIPYYYKKNKFGHVVNASINKYVYVYIKKQNFLFNENYRLNYSKTEFVNKISEVKNEIIRECLKYFNINDKMYIGTISDVPTNTGLGSSSSFTVGLVNALAFYKNKKLSKLQLAKIASEIEMKLNKNIIGKQDHFAATFGGFNAFKFLKNNKVNIRNLNLKNNNLNKMQNYIQLYYTGKQRSALNHLKIQRKNFQKNFSNLNFVREKSCEFEKILSSGKFDIYDFAKNLEKAWENKKKFHNRVSNNEINNLYDFAKNNGALSGKILGAGGGGFFMFIVPPKKQKKLKGELIKKKIYNLNFRFENKGSTIFSI